MKRSLKNHRRNDILAIITAIGACVGVSAFGQGTFQDLDFEEATLVGSGGFYNAADAFPGWQAELNGVATSDVVLDGVSIGGAGITLVDNNTGSPYYSPGAIQGNYSAILFSGGLGSLNNLASASLSQTGTVPAGTQSIQFDVGEITYGPPFIVTLGGTPIDMVPLNAFVNYELWGGNIPPLMAGQTENLTITEPIPTGPPPSALELDDIVFSPVTVTPEPQPYILMGIGGSLFALFPRFTSKCK